MSIKISVIMIIIAALLECIAGPFVAEKILVVLTAFLYAVRFLGIVIKADTLIRIYAFFTGVISIIGYILFKPTKMETLALVASAFVIIVCLWSDSKYVYEEEETPYQDDDVDDSKGDNK